MVDVVIYEFKYSKTRNITPEELLINTYAEKVYESEHVITSTKWLHVILDAKYKKLDLNNVVKNQCQHLT